MQTAKFIFPFTPQTWVRTTQNAKTIFRIPEEQLQAASLRYKKRLIRYSEYKTDLLGYAKEKGFQFAVAGSAVYFFLPMPKRWSKKEKQQSHYELHLRKPDLSNLLKAFEDSLLPKKDQGIGGYAGLAKFWVDASQGWIEVHLNMTQYNPKKGLYETLDKGFVEEVRVAREAFEKATINLKRNLLFPETILDESYMMQVRPIGSNKGVKNELFPATVNASNTDAMNEIRKQHKKSR